MSKILKMDALRVMVSYLSSNDYDVANEIMSIIMKSQAKDKKNNVISNYIELKGKKEEKYFNENLIIKN